MRAAKGSEAMRLRGMEGWNILAACGFALILLTTRQPANNKGWKEKNNARLIERLKLLLNILFDR